jgi:hypothetical protein
MRHRNGCFPTDAQDYVGSYLNDLLRSRRSSIEPGDVPTNSDVNVPARCPA